MLSKNQPLKSNNKNNIKRQLLPGVCSKHKVIEGNCAFTLATG